MQYSGAGGKLIHEKNQKQKISWHCPFKPTGEENVPTLHVYQLFFLADNQLQAIAVTGNIRRFRRICEHIQSMVCVSRRVAPPASPRAKRRSARAGDLSESESIGSDTSERMSDRLTPLPSPRQVHIRFIIY